MKHIIMNATRLFLRILARLLIFFFGVKCYKIKTHSIRILKIQ